MIEISFFEDLINIPCRVKIKNIIDYYPLGETELKIANYDLVKPVMNAYCIEEIILEKMRAVMTREQFKQRDAFDLYVINKSKDIFLQKREHLFRKLESSPFRSEDVIKNIRRFAEEDIQSKLAGIVNEIDSLSLIKFREKEFINFMNKLDKRLKQLSNKYLDWKNS